MSVTGIMMVGVGGQGTLLASRVLGSVFTDEGYDVKVSEVHGMSQRGGSVVTYVKYGDKVASPVVDAGEADFILAFELLEAARWLPCLKTDGTLIVNNQKINPMPVITGAAKYPENIVEKIRGTGADILPIEALSLAEKAGSSKSVNIVLLGVLSKLMPDIPEEAWHKAMAAVIKPGLLAVNETAFELGRAAI